MEAIGKSDFEAIVFDAYGTLFDLDSFASEANRIHRGRGKAISQTVRQKQLEFAMTRDIIGKYSNFEILTRNAIEFALKKSGIKRTDAAVEKLYAKFLSLRTFKDVPPALSDLDELNVRVAILSNGTQPMLDKLIEKAGLSLLAEDVISVDGAKAYKPNPKAYRHGMNELEVFEKEKIFYMSGNSWDVAGAKAFGFKVGWINRMKQPLFDEGFYEFRPDYEFSNLSQITKLFE
ncbi:MAG TPA: haloacid dehalogenase type II [Nitrososphaerales archaeon]|nr:haloacid dehalogenase type II [Nitrososphaerales archaeon]